MEMELLFTLKQLQLLNVIATEENFTKAAKILYISQPSLSKQLKTLEKNLDTILVNRKNNKITLTESGEVFLQYSKRILTICEESYRAITDLKNGDRGSLKVGVNETIGTYLMPKVLTLLTQNYPQINFKVQVNSTRIIAKNIISGKIDIGVVGGNIPNELKKPLKIENFMDDEFCLIIPESHLFGKKKTINTEDLYKLNFITLNSNSCIQKFINYILIQNQIEVKQLKTIMQLNSIEAIKIAVSLGLGTAFLSSSSFRNEIEFKTVKIKNIRLTKPLSMISNPIFYKSKAFSFFYRQLCNLKYIV